MTNTQRDKGAWEVKRVEFTGDASYPYRVIGVNHYCRDRGEDGRFIWRTPASPGLDMTDYDISGAVFSGLSELSEGRRQ